MEIRIKKEMLQNILDQLRTEHSAGTIYEDDEHDPFVNLNGGSEGDPCEVCSLLVEINSILQNYKK